MAWLITRTMPCRSYLQAMGILRVKYESWQTWCKGISRLPVVPHKAVAEVSKIGNL